MESITTNASAGACLWLVSSDLAPGDDYSVKISSATDGNLFDVSDKPFYLDVPRITGIRQEQDGAWVLSWTGTSSEVFVEFSPTLDPGPWQSLAGPVTGSAWTNSVPAPKEGFYRLRLK